MAYIFTVEGPAGIRYYTVNSNILLLVSAIGYLACFASGKEIPKYAVCVPALISILYGIIALILNAVKVMKGPYLSLELTQP